MKIKSFLVGLAGAGLLAGCVSLPPGAEPGPDGTMAYDVLIESTEPGARIEANGQYIGNTPVHLKIFGDPDGTFHDFGSYQYIIAAAPLVTNQFPQVRVYGTGHLFTPEDRIPQRVYFDMNVPSQSPAPYTAAPAPGYPSPPPPYYYGPPAYYGPGVYVAPRPYYYYHH